ncbi:MAG TPA: TonB-dependent receptor, partial [Burkholderiales bacterium]|nr:TonB-dependent receptor [Burkholderiales bacterium]
GTKQTRAFTGLLRALSYDIAFYHTNVTNEIVPYRGGRFYFTAGRAERQGAEIGLMAQTTPGISVRTAWTFSDNRYRNYMVDSVHYDPARTGRFADYSDNRIVGVPSRFFAIDVSYEPSFMDLIRVAVEMENSGRYFADDANHTEVPGYSLFGASVSLRRPVRLASGMELKAFVRAENLGNRKYIGSAFLNPDVVNGKAVAFEPGLPRHIVVSLSLGWSRNLAQ